jgi:hypothetical protein
MGKKSLFWLAGILVGEASLANSFTRASTHGHIGETGTLHQTEEGYFLHPFYNDFFGGTDRHLTNMFYLGGLWKLSSNDSLEITGNWRFITPDTRSNFEQSDTEKRGGVFSDWISIDSAYRKSIETGLGMYFGQIEAGFGNIGNHGAKSVQSSMHRAMNNISSNLYYDAPVEGNTISSGAQGGKIGTIWGNEYQITIGAHSNPFMKEGYAQTSLAIPLGRSRTATLDLRHIRQYSSELYQDYGLLSFRHEVALGLKISKSWVPTLKFVSPFISRDRGWQTYLDLVSVNIPSSGH